MAQKAGKRIAELVRIAKFGAEVGKTSESFEALVAALAEGGEVEGGEPGGQRVYLDLPEKVLLFKSIPRQLSLPKPPHFRVLHRS